MTSRRTILHLIQQLSLGGAGRALMALAKVSSSMGRSRHRVLSLHPPDLATRREAEQSQLEVLSASGAARGLGAIAAADVTQVHFWNTPELYAFLLQSLPPQRLLIWFHVNGESPPHVITPELVRFADVAVATCPRSLRLDRLQGAGTLHCIPGGADLERLDRSMRKPPTRFRVGYIGSVDRRKLSPAFLDICSHPSLAAIEFVVCGEGIDRNWFKGEAQRRGLGEQIRFMGYVDPIGPVLAGFGTLLMPMSPQGYATSDLAIQEAQHLGVPVVTFQHPGADDLVQQGVTGFRVESVVDCVQVLERLASDAALRERLGREAMDHADRHLGATHTAARVEALYDEMVADPRRQRRNSPLAEASPAWPLPLDSGTSLFLRSLGEQIEPFETSLLAGDGPSAREADDRIRSLAPPLAGAGGGGVLHYRGWYPDDPHLRLWAGLVYSGQGRQAMACLEFRQAQRLGIPAARVDPLIRMARSAATPAWR